MFQSKRGLVELVLVFATLWWFPAGSAHAWSAKNAPKASDAWKLVWSDEFNGPDDSLPDPGKWDMVTGGSGFGNNEQQYYTARTANAHQEKGYLVVTARKETYTGADGASRAYTSARMETKGRFEQQYGRMEARIKVPKGQGIWPAFWMLGNDFDAVGWPECGEVDIMENVGFEPSIVHGSLHGPGYSGSEPLTGTFTLPRQGRFSDDFHVFAVEWEPREIRFYVDGTLYERQTADNLPPNKHWAFNHPFFLLLDLAVGGYWPGDPDATTPFPATMLVDYVRVYRREKTQERTMQR